MLAMTEETKPKAAPRRAAGGLKVAAQMTPQEKRDRARKGAVARWGEKTLNATHKGNFKEDFGLDVECYVLDDENKTAVISQRGMGAALGSSTSGQSFIRLVSGKTLAPFLGAEVRAKVEKPLKYQWAPGGAEKQPPGEMNGYDVTLLIDVCKAIITAEAEGKLLHQQRGLARQAHVILGASAKAGIKGLAYALAGYKPETEEVIAAFKAYVQEEAKKYEQEFPAELYTAWQRLYKIPLPSRGKPWQFMHLTVKHIYFPLAKSNGKLLELMRALKSKDGDRKKKLFQFLNEVGTRALRMHMGRVLEMAESSAENSGEYEAKFVERFGGQQELDLLMPQKASPA